MKIGYFADGPWAHKAFEKIINDSTIQICFLTVRYDKKDPILLQYADSYNIPVILNKNVNSDEYLSEIEKYKCDLLVSMSFNQIFKGRIRELTPFGIINCHAGKLPFYRGRNILNWALINDEKEFGITTHFVDGGIDTGDIILQKVLPITEQDDYCTLLQRAYIACADVLYEALKMIQENRVKPIKQNSIDAVGTYFGVRTDGDEVINWNETSREVYNFIRALCKPGPQATSYIGNKTLRINRAKLIPDAQPYKNTVGQVVGKTEHSFYVKTKDTMIEIIEYEYEGKIRIGDRLSARKV